MNKQAFLILNRADNVGLALQDLQRGESVSYGNTSIRLLDDVPFGHKFSLSDIDRGNPIVKDGLTIGEATVDIRKGSHVHTHNIASRRSIQW